VRSDRQTAMNVRHRLSAVIFDCDGVMFDSRQANIHFYNHLRSRYGLPPMSEAQKDYVHMHTADQSVRHIFEGTPFTDEAQAYRLQVDYAPFIEDMIMEPGLTDLLRYLRPKVGLAVATNRSNTIGVVLDQYGLSGFFDMVVSSLDVTHPKPHPESIFKILDFFRIDPGQAVYIGDSPIDLETAEASGVHFIAYGNGGLAASLKAKTMADVGKILANFV